MCNLSVAAVVVAAGRGIRAGGQLPKQYQLLGGQPALRRALWVFIAHPRIDVVQAVIAPQDGARFAAAVTGLTIKEPVIGGASRQQSVLAGLEAFLHLAAPLEQIGWYSGQDGVAYSPTALLARDPLPVSW